MVEVVNRYANQDLLIPNEVHERMGDIVARSDKDSKPFPRQVDAWWFGIGIGLRLGVRTPLPDKTVKFNDAGILSSDPWRITHLEALALSEEGESSLQNPAQVIRIASEYATTGLLWMAEQTLGEAEPTLKLMNSVGDLIQ